MVDSLYRRAYFWRRLRANPLGKLIEEYVAYFRDLGYTWLTVRARVQSLEHFGAWLRSKSFGPKDVNPDLVQQFISEHLPKCHCPRPAPTSLRQLRPALKHLLQLLRQKGMLSEVVHRGPVDVAISRFDTYLRDVCGSSESTRISRVRCMRQFLDWKFGKRKPRWTALRPNDVVSFVTCYAKSHGPKSMGGVTSSLRCIFRFLIFRGWADNRLIAAVPRVAHWRLSSIPKSMSEDQVRDLLATFNQSTANGLRDRAMALCQVILGLRVSEVANLKLDDVNWRTGTVLIRPTKGIRPRELPMPVQVGQALVRYLREGRPPGRCRNVFVRHRGARGAPVTPALIRGVMRMAYAKVAGCEHLGGTHILRHTAATRLLNHGTSLKEIADILGHQSIDTTAIYAKVDLQALIGVAQPWPEVRQ